MNLKISKIAAGVIALVSAMSATAAGVSQGPKSGVSEVGVMSANLVGEPQIIAQKLMPMAGALNEKATTKVVLYHIDAQGGMSIDAADKGLLLLPFKSATSLILSGAYQAIAQSSGGAQFSVVANPKEKIKAVEDLASKTLGIEAGADSVSVDYVLTHPALSRMKTKALPNGKNSVEYVKAESVNAAIISKKDAQRFVDGKTIAVAFDLPAFPNYLLLAPSAMPESEKAMLAEAFLTVSGEKSADALALVRKSAEPAFTQVSDTEWKLLLVKRSEQAQQPVKAVKKDKASSQEKAAAVQEKMPAPAAPVAAQEKTAAPAAPAAAPEKK